MNKMDTWYVQVPTVMTEHLMLRPMEKADYASIQKLYSDQELYRYLGRSQNYVEKHPDCLFNQKSFISRKRHVLRFVIAQKEEENMVGELMLYNIYGEQFCKIGCRILREYQKKGIATEATRAMLDFFREQEVFPEVQADVMVGNIASCKALEKSGFVKEGMSWNGRYYRYIARQDRQLL